MILIQNVVMMEKVYSQRKKIWKVTLNYKPIINLLMSLQIQMDLIKNVQQQEI